jgi:hypothetical protein
VLNALSEAAVYRTDRLGTTHIPQLLRVLRPNCGERAGRNRGRARRQPSGSGVVREQDRAITDGRSWLVKTGAAELAIIPPARGWVQYPGAIHAAVFTQGGPEGWWALPGGDIAVIQVASQSRDGLPAFGSRFVPP